ARPCPSEGAAREGLRPLPRSPADDPPGPREAAHRPVEARHLQHAPHRVPLLRRELVEVTSYVLRRLLFLPVVLWAVSFIVFVLMRAVPGDPTSAIVGEKAPLEIRERVRRERGFDRPILVQYGIYLGKLLQGDLGESYKHSSEKVSSQIARKLPH